MRIDGNADIKQLISFMEIVKEENFTRASRNLRIGQATISHHISSLEELAGAPLFTRSSRGVELTREGILLKDFCRGLFRKIEVLKEKLKEEDASRTILVAASNIPGTYILPETIGRMKKEGHRFCYRIELSDSREVIEKLKEGTSDIGFTGTRMSHPLLNFTEVSGDRIILVGPQDAPDNLRMEELAEYDFILRHKGSGTRTAWENYLNDKGISPTVLKTICECSATECVKQAVMAGLGLAFISDQAVRRKIKAGLMKEIKVSGMNLKRKFYMVSRSDRTLGKAEGLLLEEMKCSGTFS